MLRRNQPTVTSVRADIESVTGEWLVVLSTGDNLIFSDRKKAMRFVDGVKKSVSPIAGETIQDSQD